MKPITTKDRAVGSLLGGAAGDALGYPIEFHSYPNIIKRYGAPGITRYEYRNGMAQISDDTQMTLSTANGLLKAKALQECTIEKGDFVEHVWAAYREWYHAQIAGKYPWEPQYIVSSLPEMAARRAPGFTCLNALENHLWGTRSDRINDSKGCGGIMRVAPVGLLYAPTLTSTDRAELALDLAALTHGHSLGFLPAAFMAYLISEIVYPAPATEGRSIQEIVEYTMQEMERLYRKEYQRTSYMNLLVNRAIELSHLNETDMEAISMLGKGNVAEETLAIAIYCSLKHIDNFEAALVASVNHSGDSDSTGSVTGNILGAWLGRQAIPPYYTENLELHDILVMLAEDLASDCTCNPEGTPTPEQEVRYQRYIRNKFNIL